TGGVQQRSVRRRASNGCLLKDNPRPGRSCTDLDRRLGLNLHRAQRHQLDRHDLPLPVHGPEVKRYRLTALQARVVNETSNGGRFTALRGSPVWSGGVGGLPAVHWAALTPPIGAATAGMAAAAVKSLITAALRDKGRAAAADSLPVMRSDAALT